MSALTHKAHLRGKGKGEDGNDGLDANTGRASPQRGMIREVRRQEQMGSPGGEV